MTIPNAQTVAERAAALEGWRKCATEEDRLAAWLASAVLRDTYPRPEPPKKLTKSDGKAN